jgi:hypothetical protein
VDLVLVNESVDVGDPFSGLHSSSSRMTSIFAPLMPPVAFTASSWSW